MIKLTPFFPRIDMLCHSKTWQNWEDFLIPDTFNFSLEREYYAIRYNCALLDFSPLYIYRIKGKDAVSLINMLVTREITQLSIHQVLYSCWCNNEGFVLDDGLIFRCGENEYQLTTNKNNYTYLLSTVENNAFQVELVDLSTELVTLSLQGPKSYLVLNEICTKNINDLKYFHLTDNKINHMDIQISRTGYTGDLGYELWIKKENACDIWDAIYRLHNKYAIEPVGFAALDIARIEAGLIWHGYDYTIKNEYINNGYYPYELNLTWTVNLAKKEFIGKEALIQVANSTDIRKFYGFKINTAMPANVCQIDFNSALFSIKYPWRSKREVIDAQGNLVGYATSGTWSPMLNEYIAIGCLAAIQEQEPLFIKVIIHNAEEVLFPIEKVSLPFLTLKQKTASVMITN